MKGDVRDLEAALEEERHARNGAEHALHEKECEIEVLKGELDTAQAQIAALKRRRPLFDEPDRQTAQQEFEDLFADPAATDPYEQRMEVGAQ